MTAIVGEAPRSRENMCDDCHLASVMATTILMGFQGDGENFCTTRMGAAC